MEFDAQTKNRLKRAEGQLRGVLRMMEDDNECKDVITQLSAIRSAIDKTIGVIVSQNLVNCITHTEDQHSNEQLIQDAVQLLVKSR